MPKRTSSYRERLLEDLRDPREAAHYLSSATEEGMEFFLVALRNVSEAFQMARVAKGAGVERETIYRMLSETGNPRLSSLWDLFPYIGVRIRFEPLLLGREQEHLPSRIDDAIREASQQPQKPCTESNSEITDIGTWLKERNKSEVFQDKPAASASEVFYANAGAQR